MLSKGIRGAITVDDNTEKSIKDATLELLNEIVKANNIVEDNISHVFFTLIQDLKTPLMNLG